MSTVEYDTAVYYSELTDAPETVECDNQFCSQLVRPDELVCVRTWNLSGWEWYDVCAECAKEFSDD